MAGKKPLSDESLGRRIRMLAIASLDDANCPSSDDLAQHILDTLPSPRKEEVATHVASCMICQDLVRTCTPPPDAPIA